MSLDITGTTLTSVVPPGLSTFKVLTATTGNVSLTEQDIIVGNISLTTTAARTITLPAPKAGYKVRFTLNANLTGGALTLAAGGTLLNGVLLNGATPLVVRASSNIIIAVFAATPTGGAVGDFVEFTCIDGVNWSVFGLSKTGTTFTLS